MNFNKLNEIESHWICFVRNHNVWIYFDSVGQITPIELQNHLKTQSEFENEKCVIQIDTDIVPRPNTHVCGHFYIFDA